MSELEFRRKTLFQESQDGVGLALGLVMNFEMLKGNDSGSGQCQYKG